MKRLWDDAARAFLRAIILDGVIKVDTGMSKASLLPLARYLRILTEVKASIKPTGDNLGQPKEGAFDLDGTWHPNRVRSKSTGELSSKRKAGWNVLYGSSKRAVFVFDFEIKVFQYLVHENGWKGFQAWKTIEIGRAAFEEHLFNNFEPFNLKEWGLV